MNLPSIRAYGWGNGSSRSVRYPYYGVHDIIADVAYQRLRDCNATAASWITDYYLNLSGGRWGDYQYSFGCGADNWLSYTDDPDSCYADWKNHLYEVHGTQRGALGRVRQCYDWIVANLTKWILYGRVPRPIPTAIYANAPLMLMASDYAHQAAYAAGLLTHYFSDLSQFGHTENSTKDYSHPAYDPADRTYHGYYEVDSISENLLDRMLVDLGGYAFKVDERVADVEMNVENFARWVNSHNYSSVPYIDTGGKVLTVGSTYKQLLTDFVDNYDAGVSYLNARGYSSSLYALTMLHISAAVGNITRLLYSAYKDAEEEASSVDRIRASTRIDLDLASTSIRVGEALNLQAALSTENGSRVEGQTIYLSIIENETSPARYTVLSSAITDASGKSNWRYTGKLGVGTYRLVAWYIGNETYSPSFEGRTFTVRLPLTSLDLTLNPTTQGKPTTFKATLKDESGRPIRDASIDFYVEDVTCGSSKTNSEGTATLTFTPPKAGAFQVRARYAGGDLYSGSSSEPSTLEVGADHTLYAVAGLMSIITLIAILLIKRRY